MKASHLYWLLIGESIAQFRYYDHRISTADMANDENVADVYKKKCPVCPQVTTILR